MKALDWMPSESRFPDSVVLQTNPIGHGGPGAIKKRQGQGTGVSKMASCRHWGLVDSLASVAGHLGHETRTITQQSVRERVFVNFRGRQGRAMRGLMAKGEDQRTGMVINRTR